MVVDTSALLAILQGEPESDTFQRAISAASERCISAVSVLETGLVFTRRRGERGMREMEDFIDAAGLTIVPLDARQAALGTAAFLRFGKGCHPAALNFGDCAAYALARSRDQPLLFKGEDFGRTDVVAAIPWRR